METIVLPITDNSTHSAPIDMFYYRTSDACLKQRVILNTHTISFLMEGQKEVFFDTASMAISNDQFLIMKSGHCLMTEKLSGPQQHYESMLLFFSNDALLRFMRKYEIHNHEESVKNSVHRFNYDAFIRHFTQSLIGINTLEPRVQKHMLELKFEELMLYLVARHGTEFIDALITTYDNHIQRFVQTVESNRLHRLSLKELAFLCHMSISSFKRAFEKHYGSSPSKWFQDQRLEHAYHLMKDYKKRASDVYLEVGYENLSSFVQAYRLKYGVSPKQHHKN